MNILHCFFIVRNLLLLGDASLIFEMLEEAHTNLVFGALEADPDLAHDRPKFREYLRYFPVAVCGRW